MKNYNFIFFLIIPFLGLSQKLEIANKYYDEYDYIKAAEMYKEILKKGDTTEVVFSNLANCYYNNGRTLNAIKYFEQFYEKYPENVELENRYRYIQSLRSIGQYDKADLFLNDLEKVYSDDSRISKLNKETKDYYLNQNDEYVYDIKKLAVNSKTAEFGNYLHKGAMYFSAPDNESRKKYNWNKEKFLDLYKGVFDTVSKEVIDVVPLNENINSPYHEGSVTITKDGKTMYFTRDLINNKGKIIKDEKGTINLNIFRSKLENGDWGVAEVLPFCSEAYSTGHPALSPDGKKMYFVSDVPGGFGNTDLYYVDINEDGTFGNPKNLGKDINTEGTELFPFVTEDFLYFSSDGHLGIGLLDIFKCKINNEKFDKVVALEQPINSPMDDFSFFIEENKKDNEKRMGFFSSNRDDKNDDMFMFYVEKGIEYISGTITNAKTREPLEDVQVKLIDKTGKVLKTVNSDSDGKYIFTVEFKNNYTISASKNDFKSASKDIEIGSNLKNNNIVDLELTPLIIDNEIVIKPIYFDYNKWDIRIDAALELENIVGVLKNNPDMVIHIESHTDCRGEKTYNEKLSDNRAKATRDYLFTRGVELKQIPEATGYGENQLLNNCNNKCDTCSEDEHQLNRRSVFVIIEKSPVSND